MKDNELITENMKSFPVTHPLDVVMCAHCGSGFLEKWIDGDHWFFKCETCQGEFYARPLQWEVRYSVPNEGQDESVHARRPLRLVE